MKKNSTMRVAALLLALTLMTSCFVGGTFAKYTTYGEGLDSARVAKWGVTVDGSALKAFVSDYGTTVNGEGDVKVVAPGTEGAFSNFEISGTPEVAVKIIYGATVELSGNWLDENGKFYCPLKVYVNGTPLCGLQYASADAFEQAIVDHVVAITNTYAPGTVLGDVVEDDLSIAWAWSFVSDGTDYYGTPGDGMGEQTDRSDTQLGNWATTDSAPAIRIDVKCTIEQVD